MLDYRRAEEMVRELTGNAGVLDYTPEQARLLVQVLRTLARGRPVSAQEIDVIATDFGWAPEAAHGFLRPLTERDAADAIIGVFPGLSLGNHPHRLSVNGRQMSAWCAEDTLFLPALLGQTAMIVLLTEVLRVLRAWPLTNGLHALSVRTLKREEVTRYGKALALPRVYGLPGSRHRR